MRSFFSVFLALLGVVGAFAAQCSLSDYEKVDCGYVGIDQSGCESKGCCWQSSTTSGTPWCFYGAGQSTSCFGFSVSFSAQLKLQLQLTLVHA